MSDFSIKQITLPSGQKIDIVYYHAEAIAELPPLANPPQTQTEASSLTNLSVCTSCSADRVYPVEWMEIENEQWEMDLRCPDCEHRTALVCTHEEAELFDDALNTATDSIMDSLEQLSRTNMEEDIRRLAYALEHDLLLPSDF